MVEQYNVKYINDGGWGGGVEIYPDLYKILSLTISIGFTICERGNEVTINNFHGLLMDVSIIYIEHSLSNELSDKQILNKFEIFESSVLLINTRYIFKRLIYFRTNIFHFKSV